MTTPATPPPPAPVPPELLPCPFCGHVQPSPSFVTNTGGNVRYLACPKCSAQGPWGTRETIHQKWNARAPLPADESIGDVESASDDLWLSILARIWKQETGELWDTRDGESREEGISANLSQFAERLCKRALAAAHTWGCGNCGWSENPEYDISEGPKTTEAGGVIDQFGGLTP
jgi:hypothetical protein